MALELKAQEPRALDDVADRHRACAFSERHRHGAGTFHEYIGGLGVDLSFQGVERELADTPGRYAPPSGTILLARDRQNLAMGCVALRALPTVGDCEMKRLYVRPEARGQDLGRRLVEAVIAFARNAKQGYCSIRWPPCTLRRGFMPRSDSAPQSPTIRTPCPARRILPYGFEQPLAAVAENLQELIAAKQHLIGSGCRLRSLPRT